MWQVQAITFMSECFKFHCLIMKFHVLLWSLVLCICDFLTSEWSSLMLISVKMSINKPGVTQASRGESSLVSTTQRPCKAHQADQEGNHFLFQFFLKFTELCTINFVLVRLLKTSTTVRFWGVWGRKTYSRVLQLDMSVRSTVKIPLSLLQQQLPLLTPPTKQIGLATTRCYLLNQTVLVIITGSNCTVQQAYWICIVLHIISAAV